MTDAEIDRLTAALAVLGETHETDEGGGEDRGDDDGDDDGEDE